MSDLSMPEDRSLVPTAVHDEAGLVKLAREIAMDLREPHEILERHGFTQRQWELLQNHPRFMEILSAERAAWEGAVNTHERVRLKAGAMMEDWLTEGYNRMIDPGEKLIDKVKVAELVARLADMGTRGVGVNGAGEVDRVSITINLGAEAHTFNKQVTPKVIDVTPTETDHAPAD